ncbi:larval cuticle protein 16/17-like [Centruroides sculpturatus]|uniref:larval cuticle protein 16/17-like n=1 Tax=Centruroides sculpturatus TaxID=218467 RepID=UPI000C6EA362|nr:larval cuticle protein 16/17-like [Centruroides sculpturatus]
MKVLVLLLLVSSTIRAEESNDDGASRNLFHEQGLNGPHSYRYGYDTGDGPNRQTKYEERDDKGIVRGSYTFVDPHGKVQVVTYEAHPKYGFRAKGSFGVFPRKS